VSQQSSSNCRWPTTRRCSVLHWSRTALPSQRRTNFFEKLYDKWRNLVLRVWLGDEPTVLTKDIENFPRPKIAPQVLSNFKVKCMILFGYKDVEPVIKCQAVERGVYLEILIIILKTFFFTTRGVRCVHHGWHGTHRTNFFSFPVAVNKSITVGPLGFSFYIFVTKENVMKHPV
jgi:hypothetical protein